MPKSAARAGRSAEGRTETYEKGNKDERTAGSGRKGAEANRSGSGQDVLLVRLPRRPRNTKRWPRAEGILFEHLLGKRAETVIALAHIGDPSREPDARPRRNRDHAAFRSARIAAIREASSEQRIRASSPSSITTSIRSIRSGAFNKRSGLTSIGRNFGAPSLPL